MENDQTTHRLLLVYETADRPFAEVLADHLTRDGYSVVLDIKPHPARAGTHIIVKHFEHVELVLTLLSARTKPSGSISRIAKHAAEIEKLLVVAIDDKPHPIIEGNFRVASLSSWDGTLETQAIFEAFKLRLTYELGDIRFSRRAVPQPEGVSDLGQSVYVEPANPYTVEPNSEAKSLPTMRVLTSLHHISAMIASERRVFADDSLSMLQEDVQELRERPPTATAITEAIYGDDGEPKPQAASFFGSSAERRDSISMSMRSPRLVKPSESFLFQVWLFRNKHAGAVRALSKEADKESRNRGTRFLGRHRRGSCFKISLDPMGLTCRTTTYYEKWSGEPISVQFHLTAPDILLKQKYFPTVRISIDGVPLVTHAVSIDAIPDTRRAAKPKRSVLRPYREAFLSYASEDRHTVFLQAQALRAAGVAVFQDVLNIEPGDRWEQRLYTKIADADLFLLFWSKHAAASEWVRKEAEFALQCQRSGRRRGPDIVPVILDGPPPPTPPRSLQHIHFNDPVRCVIASYEWARA